MRIENFPTKKYDIIYADPPWDYKGHRQHSKKDQTGGAISHYDTVTVKNLAELPVGSIANDNALLFMWTSSPHLDQAIWLGRQWGFRFTTVAFVWDKQRVNPGYYTMSQCEICLVFKRGRIPTPRGCRNIRQYVPHRRESHSKKPDEVRDRIRQMFPTQSAIELFATNTYENWDTWGDGLSQTNLCKETA
jgi:N6-adenosine-specific RNA methylase IME4